MTGEQPGGIARDLLPVVFIGPMGSGKSSVAAYVARAWNAPLIDVDVRIEAEYGLIPEIFEREGEEYFRVIEREVVAEAFDEIAVIAVGGGAVLNSDTRRELERATTIHLQVSADAVGERLIGGRRPLLAQLSAGADAASDDAAEASTDAGTDDATGATTDASTGASLDASLDEWIRIADERAGIYARLADLTIDTSGLSTAQVGDEVLAWAAARGSRGAPENTSEREERP